MEASHLDPINVQLLEILQHDATQTLDELGATVGLSGSAVQRRIKQHERSGLFDLALVVTARNMADHRRIAAELLDADANVRRFVSHVTLGTMKASLAVPLEPNSP